MSRHPARSIIIVFLLATPLFPAWGETLSALPVAGKLVLTPQKTESLLLEQGIGVELLRLDNQAEALQLQKSRARYDTVLNLSGDHTIDKSARTSSFFGTRTDTSSWNLGLEKNIGLGTRLGFDFENERVQLYNPSSITGNTKDPTFEPKLGLNLNQSLGQNFFGSLDRAEVQAVEHGIRSFDYKTGRQIHQKLIEGLRLYWAWTIAREGVALGEEMLAASERFWGTIRERETIGLSEETDLLGAEAMVAKRGALLSALKQESLDWDSEMRVLLQLSPDQEMESAPSALTLPKASQADLLMEGLENRLDLKSAKEKLRAKESEAVASRSRRWPQIALTGGVKWNEKLPSDYAGALEGMDSPVYQVGLNLNISIENRAARSLSSQSGIELRKEELQLKDLENRVVQEVVRAYQGVGLSAQAYEARGKAFRLEQEKLRQALEQYRMGRFNADTILKFQDDLLFAKQDWLKAKLDWALALLKLREALR